MPLTVAQKLNIASICEYIISNAIKKGGLDGSGIDLLLPQKIYNIRTTIQYLYGLNPADTSLESTTNYLYAMCGKYALAAQVVNNQAGTIAGVSGAASAPNPYDFIVSASSFIVTGATTKTITAFIGYNIEFVRASIPQYTTNPGDGSTYYSFDKNTGIFTLSVAAGVDERFRISAV